MQMSSNIAQSVIMLVLFAVIACFGLAVSIEIYRRSRKRMLQVKQSWDMARSLSAEKNLNGAQWALLRTMLKRHAPEAPYAALTETLKFDRCVREEIKGVANALKREDLGEALREIRIRLGLTALPPGVQWHSTLEIEEGITLYARPADNESQPYKDFFLRRTNDAYFYVTPRHLETVRNIGPGDKLAFYLWRAEDARYEFVAPVVRIEKDPVGIVFPHVYTIKRIQTRAHFRIPYVKPAAISLYSVPEEELVNPLPWIMENAPLLQLQGAFSNLSAGGFAAVAPQAPPPRAYVKTALVLDDDLPTLAVYARIVGAVLLSDQRCLLRAMFCGLTETQEEAISQYVFRKQQQQQFQQRTSAGREGA